MYKEYGLLFNTLSESCYAVSSFTLVSSFGSRSCGSDCISWSHSEAAPPSQCPSNLAMSSNMPLILSSLYSRSISLNFCRCSNLNRQKTIDIDLEYNKCKTNGIFSPYKDTQHKKGRSIWPKRLSIRISSCLSCQLVKTIEVDGIAVPGTE